MRLKDLFRDRLYKMAYNEEDRMRFFDDARLAAIKRNNKTELEKFMDVYDDTLNDTINKITAITEVEAEQMDESEASKLEETIKDVLEKKT
jgi:hypothetical protein